jgi:hypothetical protein
MVICAYESGKTASTCCCLDSGGALAFQSLQPVKTSKAKAYTRMDELFL